MLLDEVTNLAACKRQATDDPDSDLRERYDLVRPFMNRLSMCKGKDHLLLKPP